MSLWHVLIVMGEINTLGRTLGRELALYNCCTVFEFSPRSWVWQRDWRYRPNFLILDRHFNRCVCGKNAYEYKVCTMFQTAKCFLEFGAEWCLCERNVKAAMFSKKSKLWENMADLRETERSRCFPHVNQRVWSELNTISTPRCKTIILRVVSNFVILINTNNCIEE